MRIRVVFVCVLWLPACAATAGDPAPPYRFAGGEKIRLIVPATVGESIEQLVLDDGSITLPIGGAINIKGKTKTEAEAAATEALGKEAGAKRVYAAIALLDIPPRRVYVWGEVKLPQAILLAPGTPMTLAAALASAGGATGEADLSKVRVYRPGAGGAAGKEEVVNFDASPSGERAGGGLGPVLQAGDVVSVPKGDVFILAGEVAKAGGFNRKELSLSSSDPALLSRVLFGAGGLKPGANRRDIRVIRTGSGGAREVLSVNLDDVLRAGGKSGGDSGGGSPPSGSRKPAPDGAGKGDPADRPTASDDPVLQSGDIVVAVQTGGVAILGRVKLPGVYPLGGESLKLTRLIALAGGFSDFARTSSVLVSRADPKKPPQKVDVEKITKEGGLDKDVDLEDGDLVFVGERML